jgi:hypothetical protein
MMAGIVAEKCIKVGIWIYKKELWKTNCALFLDVGIHNGM